MKELGEAAACVVGIVFVATYFVGFFFTMSAWKDEVLCEQDNNVYSCVRVYVPEVVE